MSKLKGPGNGVFIKDFINDNLPPMTWNIVAVKVMKQMVEAKLKATAISPTDEFPDALVEAIDNVLQTQYNSSLPKA